MFKTAQIAAIVLAGAQAVKISYKEYGLPLNLDHYTVVNLDGPGAPVNIRDAVAETSGGGELAQT